jgi:hypothetical protein
MRIPAYFVFFAVLFLLTGCSNQVKLNGKVTFSDDGSPVPAGTIFFESSTFMARGEIRSDGTFSVSSTGNNDGLPPGTYAVSFTGVRKEVGTDRNGMPIYEELLDPKYGDTYQSGLTLEVTSSTKSYDIQVERRKKSAR